MYSFQTSFIIQIKSLLKCTKKNYDEGVICWWVIRHWTFRSFTPSQLRLSSTYIIFIDVHNVAIECISDSKHLWSIRLSADVWWWPWWSLQDEPLVHFLVITENTEVIVFGISLLPKNITGGIILYTSTINKGNYTKENKLDMK